MLRQFLRCKILRTPALFVALAVTCASCGSSGSTPHGPTTNPVPVPTWLTPHKVTAGDPSFTLRVGGSGFTASTVVRWRGADRPTSLISGAVLATIAASDMAEPGTAEITVFNPPPGGGTASAGTVRIRESLVGKAVAYQIDPAHSGRARLGAPMALPASPAWTIPFNGSVSYPLIAGGRAFVIVRGTGVGDEGSRLFALDLSSGETVWGPIVFEAPSGMTAGHAYHEGKVIVADPLGVVYSFDAATGVLVWSTLLPGKNWLVNDPPIAADGIIYVTASNNGGTLYALDADDGRVLWEVETDRGEGSVPTVGGDGVFVSYACQVYKFQRSTGELLWHQGGCFGTGRTAVFGRNGGFDWLLTRRTDVEGEPIAYFTAHMYYAPDGTDLGAFERSLSWWNPIPALDEVRGYVVWDGVLSPILQPYPEEPWSFAGDGPLMSAPLVVDDVVFVGSSSGTVFAVDAATGSQLWAAAAGAPFHRPEEAGYKLPGLAAGEGHLLASANATLTAWRIVAP